MRKLNIFIKVSIIAVLCIASFGKITYADGSVSLSADKDSCAVGDDYKVTVSAQNTQDASVAPEISITYDPNRLAFKECTCSYGGGGGGLITLNETNADITFSVLSGGIATVEASAVFDGNGANTQVSSVSLNVEGEDTAALSATPVTTDLGIEGGSIAAPDGTKQVAAVFADEFMPMGFYKTSVTYEEQLVEAAQFDMGNIILLYVTDENGNNGNFNVYDQATGELTDFLQISGIENRFIIALRAADAETPAPEGFTLATLKWNEQTLDAYSCSGLDDFFLLYAISSEGNKGWYAYDQKEGTYQRFIDKLYSGSGDVTGNTGTDSNESEGDGLGSKLGGKFDLKLIIIIALAVVLLGMLIAMIIMGLKLKDFNSYEYIDEDDYGDEDAEYKEQHKNREPLYEDRPAKKPVKQAEPVMPLRQIKSDEEITPVETGSIEPEPVGDDLIEDITLVKPAAEKKITAGELAARELNDDFEDDYEIEEKRLSRDEKKALKAEEKARKKAEKKMKKEYGEFGPADFGQWQEAVRDDRKISEDELLSAKQRAVELTGKIGDIPVKPVEKPAEKLEMPKNMRNRPAEPDITDDVKTQEDTESVKKDSPANAMRKLPANDKNEPVQPKPVQQFDLDDDFEFEYLSLDDDD